MKRYVTLTYKVRLVVESHEEESIYDWAYEHTPSEALDDAHKNGRFPREYYDEMIEFADECVQSDIVLD